MPQISGAIAMIGIWIILFPFTTKDVTRAPWLHVLLGAITALLGVWASFVSR
mgnify:CR=1 FL=1